MTDLGRAVVLAGGLSHEREVSLRSGRRVTEALREVGVEVDQRDVDADLLPALAADPPAAVFPALHGAAGEDGAIRGVLELLGLPYVGAAPDGCRVAFDKPTAKATVRAAGLTTPPAVALPKEMFHDLGASAVLDRVVGRLGLPLFVKPGQGGSALGAALVQRREELPGAMIGCFGYGDTALIENYVPGTEVAVSVIDLGQGPEPLPAIEIVPDGPAYDYVARYTAGQAEFFAPARLTTETARRASDVAVASHRALGLRDLSRTDLIIDRDGGVHFLEVNVAPGMTETSTLPMAAEAAGMEPGVLYRDLLHAATRRLDPSS